MDKEFEEMINKYLDEELSKGEEIVLFSQLSQNPEAIDYFKKMNLLRNSVEKTKEEFPGDLEEKILLSLGTKHKKLFSGQKILMFGSYAVTIVLLIISSYLFSSVNTYRHQAEAAVKSVNERSEIIDMLINNTLPDVVVKADFPNEIIIKAN